MPGLVIAAIVLQAAARLASVQVKGISRYTAEDVTRLSGLEIGRPVGVTDLGAAANKLAATGLFDTVKYSYTTGTAMAVVLEVVEATWNVPVILDNFVWFTDAELEAGLKAAVPSFDGTAPLNSGAAEFIARALDGFLKSRGIAGRVDFSAQQDIGSKTVRYLFAVKDPGPKVCSLHAAGASGIPESDLLAPLQGVNGGDYSRFFLATASRGTLTDMYRRRGYWRATFEPPTALVEACGVSVTLRVSEGRQYQWAGAQWSGQTALTTDALDKLLGMKAGDVADISKIEVGLRDIRVAYGKKGYVTQRVVLDPRLDDAGRTATFGMKVEEGPEYHMGSIIFEGIRESDAASLSKKWPLKSGDIYDESQEKKYFSEVVAMLQTSSGARPRISTQIDAERRLVNVKVAFQ